MVNQLTKFTWTVVVKLEVLVRRCVCCLCVQGYIKPLSQQVLTIKYLPCGPKKFQTSFQIQVLIIGLLSLLLDVECTFAAAHIANFTVNVE